ncbi:MAG: PIN domain protein [Nitrospirae bacterium]|nr:PIN domain protein [Nitrospirota bacterium]
MVKIYLDVNIYNRPFDDQSQVRIRLETIAIFSILQRIRRGDLTLLWSFMIDYENSLNPYDDVRLEIEMASSLAKEKIYPHEFVFTTAKGLESKGVKPRDALHLACATKGRAEYFLTCDDRLIKRVSLLGLDIKAMNPIRFIGMEVN